MREEDVKRIVSEAYDRIADRYLRHFGRSSVREDKLADFISRLPPRADVLDLGCGSGEPVARLLVECDLNVTGVDCSAGQIKRARRSVPTATFVHHDMTSVRFPPEAFDGVCAFYSITHVPRERHGALIERIATWLRPGGIFLASFGSAGGDWSGDWLGTSMFFSHNEPEKAKQLVCDAGLRVSQTELIQQDNEQATFLWITAQK